MRECMIMAASYLMLAVIEGLETAHLANKKAVMALVSFLSACLLDSQADSDGAFHCITHTVSESTIVRFVSVHTTACRS